MSNYSPDNDPIRLSVTRARIELLLKQPFFGSMATRLNVILTDEDKDSWCETAATDGRNMWMSRSFVASLTEQELLFVMAHEVLHCVYDSIGRRQNRDPKYYNMASDYIINYALVKGNVGTMPPVGLYDPKYDDENWTSEQVYDDLMKNQVKIQLPLDQHLDGAGTADGAQKKDGSKGQTVTVTVNGDGDGPPTLTKEEMDEIREEIRANAIQAAQAALSQTNPGCVPAGVRRMVSDLDDPKMDWRSILTETIKSAMKDDYTFMRLSRRDYGSFLLPAQDDGDKISVHIGIDTSGSMTQQMIHDIMSEVKGIMSAFNEFKVVVACWDTQMYAWAEFDQFNIDQIDEYEPQGGGGTDPTAYWEYLRDNDIVPTRCIQFTDGYVGSWIPDDMTDYCPILWVIHSNPSRNIVPPCGEVCYYEDAMADA